MYDNNNKLVEETKLHYDNTEQRFDEFIKRASLRNSIGCEDYDVLIFAAAYKIYTYRYNLISKEVIRYDNDKELNINYNYAYNDYDLIKEEVVQESDGSMLKKMYRYANDIDNYNGPTPINPVTRAILSMSRPAGKYMLRYPIETVIYKNDDVVDAYLQTYKEFGLRILPYQTFKLDINESIDDYKFSGFNSVYNTPLVIDDRFSLKSIINKYDDYGNILQIKNHESDIVTTILYGYKNTLPVAEIINQTYDEVKGYIQDYTGNTNLSSTQINSLINNLPNAQISTYTFDPLKGMTSETGPDNIKLNYEYDDFGRLKLVKDHNGHILKRYTYQYRVQ
ncbi:MAG: hypothetical protein ACOCWM_02255 [Cyclobacteriaceae bacterium]